MGCQQVYHSLGFYPALTLHLLPAGLHQQQSEAWSTQHLGLTGAVGWGLVAVAFLRAKHTASARHAAARQGLHPAAVGKQRTRDTWLCPAA